MLEGTQIKFFLEIGVQNNPPNNANKSNTNVYLFAIYWYINIALTNTVTSETKRLTLVPWSNLDCWH